MAEVFFTFQIQLIKPDMRRFGRVVELVPASPANVIVAVPLEHELIANAAEILAASVQGDKVMPILTPAGMKFVTDQMEKQWEYDQVIPSDFEPAKDDNENWSGGESTDEKEFKEATESNEEEKWSDSIENQEFPENSEAPANVLDTEAGWQEEESTDGNEHPEDTVENETWSE